MFCNSLCMGLGAVRPPARSACRWGWAWLGPLCPPPCFSKCHGGPSQAPPHCIAWNGACRPWEILLRDAPGLGRCPVPCCHTWHGVSFPPPICPVPPSTIRPVLCAQAYAVGTVPAGTQRITRLEMTWTVSFPIPGGCRPVPVGRCPRGCRQLASSPSLPCTRHGQVGAYPKPSGAFFSPWCEPLPQ